MRFMMSMIPKGYERAVPGEAYIGPAPDIGRYEGATGVPSGS